MKKVGKVTLKEREEIYCLYEKINALKNLQLIVEIPELKSKLERDIERIQCESDQWWESKSKGYQWESKENGSWMIDFNTYDIFLVEK